MAGRLNTIVVYGPPDAGCLLRFPERLEGRPTGLWALAPQDARCDLESLASAALVIVTDPLHAAWSGTIEVLKAMQVPWAAFLDGGTRLDRSWRIGSQDAQPHIATVLQGAVGLIGGSEKRCAIITTITNRPVLAWPPVFDPALHGVPQAAEDHALHVLVVGGSTRRRSFATLVRPALEQLRRERPLIAHVRFDLLRESAEDWLRPVPANLGLAVPDSRREGLDAQVVLVLPGSDIDAAAMALSSRRMGAVPILAEDEAEGLGPAQGVLLAGRDATSWLDALRRADDTAARVPLFKNLDAWCRHALGPDAVRPRLDDLAAWASPASDAVAPRERRARAEIMVGFAELASRLRILCADPPPLPLSVSLRVRLGLARRAKRLVARARHIMPHKAAR